MKLFEVHRQLVETGKSFTAETIKNKFNGVEERSHLLVEIITKHNDNIKALTGMHYSRATWVLLICIQTLLSFWLIGNLFKK